ncbi:hypothetical protein DM860_008113 [Cuscuta australis]|uniref:Uncharacterized protein n=1 Tax=Cuscuta australis TaxID=267555 RepID=A0A328D7P6_9ASTE|nr:hypothetical protein DM860_008113 [Cuscuta australis]
MGGGVQAPAGSLEENKPIGRPCLAFSGVPIIGGRAAVKANGALGYSAGKDTEDRRDIVCVLEEQQQHNRENYFKERERERCVVFSVAIVYCANCLIVDRKRTSKASLVGWGICTYIYTE